MNDTKILIDEVKEYLELSDEVLAGYGLRRDKLQSDLAMLEEEFADEQLTR